MNNNIKTDEHNNPLHSTILEKITDVTKNHGKKDLFIVRLLLIINLFFWLLIITVFVFVLLAFDLKLNIENIIFFCLPIFQVIAIIHTVVVMNKYSFLFTIIVNFIAGLWGIGAFSSLGIYLLLQSLMFVTYLYKKWKYFK